MEVAKSQANQLLGELDGLKQELHVAKQKRTKLQTTLVGAKLIGQKANAQQRRELTTEDERAREMLRTTKLIARSYRLAGVSEAPTGAYKSIRIDTSYNGQFFEQYYIILSESEKHRLTLHRHTLPYFLPMRAWTAKLAPRSMGDFVRVAERHLNAFVHRREEWRAVVKAHGAYLSRISTSDSYDTIQCRLRLPEGSVQIEARCSALSLTQPDRCVVVAARGRILTLERAISNDGLKASIDAFIEHTLGSD